MQSIINEPQRLRDEQARIHEEMVELTLKHYPLFLDSLAALSAAEDNSAAALASLDSFSRDTTILKETLCVRFQEAGLTWKAEQVLIERMQRLQPKFTALLEAPSLMESCVFNEMYHEILLFRDHIASLMQREELASLPLFVALQGEVSRAVERLVGLVLQRLSKEPSLAQAVRSVAFLRRLKILDEEGLKAMFLDLRSHRIDELLLQAVEPPASPTAGAPAPSAYATVNKIINILKLHLSEVVSQYGAVFASRPAGKAADSLADGAPPAAAGTGPAQTAAPPCGVLTHWLLRVVVEATELLSAHLAGIQYGSELRGLWDQVGSCGAAMARLHIDIRGMVEGAFSDAIVRVFNAAVSRGMDIFLQTFSSSGCVSSSVAPERPTTSSSEDKMKAYAALILDFLPLAHLTNGYLSAFNEVRRCPLPGAKVRCAAVVEQSLLRAMQHITADYRASPPEAAELAGLAALVRTFDCCVIPMVTQAFSLTFGPSAVADMRAVTKVTEPVASALCALIRADHEALLVRLSEPAAWKDDENKDLQPTPDSQSTAVDNQPAAGNLAAVSRECS